MRLRWNAICNFRCALLAVLVIPVCASSASISYDFALTGSGIGASGVFTVADIAGTDRITGMTGTFDGSGITGLFPPDGYGGNDNLFSPSSPYLDFGGVSFSVGTLDYNLFYDDGRNGCESVPSYYVFVQQSATSQTCGATVDKPVSLSLVDTSKSPEPVPVIAVVLGSLALLFFHVLARVTTALR